MLAAAPKEVEPTALVVDFAISGLSWVLDDAQRDVLLRLTPGAFGGNRADWGLALAQAWALRGDQAEVREYAEEARRAFPAPEPGARAGCPMLPWAWRSPTWAARPRRCAKQTGVWRSGDERAPFDGPGTQHLAVRIHILLGNHERALDLLEPLLKVP